MDEDLYHATPQVKGKTSHQSIDSKSYSSSKNSILSLPISSDELGVMGKIDSYDETKKLLVEKKYNLSTIYQGQIYQLWAQYFCLIEMGYEVNELAFYEIKSNKTHKITLPSTDGKAELIEFIRKFKAYNPQDEIQINENKCRHCIYCNICDKTNIENVY